MGVEDNETGQNEICATGSSQDRRERRNGNIVDTKKELGEDYARKILEFLKAAQEARRKKKKEEDDGIKLNVSAEVFQPAGEKGEAEKNERGEGVRQMKLCPQNGLMVIHSKGLSD